MTYRFWLAAPAVVGLMVGCSDYVPLGDLPVGGAGQGAQGGAPASGGAGGSTSTGGSGQGGSGATGGATGGSGGSGGSSMAGTGGAQPMTGGVGGTTGGGSGAGSGGTGAVGDPTGGTAGTGLPMGGMAGTGGSDPTGGTAGTGAEAGTGAGGGGAGIGPFSPRTGTFKVLAYSKTGGYRHTDAIDAGKPMLTAMGTKQGFTVTFSENPADFSAQNLEQYEVVFGLDPTGNNLSNAQKAAFEEWMTTKNGAFAGVHSSTDHENGWAFWSDVTGQYYDLHDTCCTQQNIQWDPAAANHPTVVGLPSPWARSEEWYKFNQNQTWSTKPGFQILSRVTTNNLTRPVSFVREWSNFRSFYTSLGHQGPTYSDANFIRHVSAGIMWAARREALIRP
jgi:type 1 glutamine amidotransferase